MGGSQKKCAKSTCRPQHSLSHISQQFIKLLFFCSRSLVVLKNSYKQKKLLICFQTHPVQPPCAEGWSFSSFVTRRLFYYEAVKLANVAFDPDATSLDSSSWRQTQWGMKQWGGRVEGRTQVRSPTSNRTDSIRGYKSSERRAQKDFERRFFLSGLLHRRVSKRAGCFRAGVFGGWLRLATRHRSPLWGGPGCALAPLQRSNLAWFGW